jgi:uncharacterized membrane protein YeiB
MVFIIAILIGLMPAYIATEKQKGLSFVGWWIYGAMIFIVALPHSLLLSRDKVVQTNPLSIADELKKLKELLDNGAITEEEFKQQKSKLI